MPADTPHHNSIRVRPAVPADYPAIAELTTRAYLDGGHLAPEDDYLTTLRNVADRNGNNLVRVAVDEETGQVLGSLTLARPGDPYAEIATGNEREFRMLAVDPDVRRRGVGHALVQAAIEWARADGADALALTTMKTMVEAHRLYETRGFHRVPERDWSLSDMGWREPYEGEPVYLVYVHPLTNRSES